MLSFLKYYMCVKNHLSCIYKTIYCETLTCLINMARVTITCIITCIKRIALYGCPQLQKLELMIPELKWYLAKDVEDGLTCHTTEISKQNTTVIQLTMKTQHVVNLERRTTLYVIYLQWGFTFKSYYSTFYRKKRGFFTPQVKNYQYKLMQHHYLCSTVHLIFMSHCDKTFSHSSIN